MSGQQHLLFYKNMVQYSQPKYQEVFVAKTRVKGRSYDILNEFSNADKRR